MRYRFALLAVAILIVGVVVSAGPVTHSTTNSPGYLTILNSPGFTTTQSSPGGSLVSTSVSRNGGGDADVNSFGQTTSLCNHIDQQPTHNHVAFGRVEAAMDLRIKTKSDQATANGSLTVTCAYTTTFTCDGALVFFDSKSLTSIVFWGPLPAAPVVATPGIGQKVKFRTNSAGGKDHIDLRWVYSSVAELDCAFMFNATLDTTASATVTWEGDPGVPLAGIDGDAHGDTRVAQALFCR